MNSGGFAHVIDTARRAIIAPPANHDGLAADDRGVPWPPPIVLIALAMMVGVAIGLRQPIDPGTAALGAMVVLMVAQCARHRRPLTIVLIMVAVLLLGWSWTTIRLHRLPSDHLLRLAGDRTLIEVAGEIVTDPKLRAVSSHPMQRFHRSAPSWTCHLSVNSFMVSHGDDLSPTSKHVRGTLTVSSADEPLHLQRGDIVRIVGWWQPPGAQRNPGGFDGRRWAMARRHAGRLTTNAGCINVLAPAARWENDSEALIDALMTGTRTPASRETLATFQRIGCAHLLAVSGLHLGMVVLPVMAVLRGTRRFARAHGLVLIAIAVGYALVVDARVPIIRAAIMLSIIGVGIAIGRSCARISVLAISAMAVLIWRPDELVSAGFQLSFGVVAALMLLVEPVRARWFGRSATMTTGWRSWFAARLGSALTATLIAWLIATPIVLHHFGVLSPLAIPLTLLMSPVVAVLVLAGLVRAFILLVVPDVADVTSWWLTIPADLLISISTFADALPGSSATVLPLHGAWAIAMVMTVAVWARFGVHRRVTLPCACSTLLLCAAATVSSRTTSVGDDVRITMLDVGDGSCFIVQSKRSAVLFDAGSLRGPDIGSQTIVPALRALGIARLDAIMISHANLDHENGVPDLINAMPVREICVTTQFMEAAKAGLADHNPTTWLLRWLDERGIDVTTIAAGDMRTFGLARWMWLHPSDDDRFANANDSSMVVRVHAHGRDVLFTGDIQRDGMRTVRGRHAALTADVLELPHHGSWHDAALAFVDAIDPSVVLQSTGRRRLEPDRWRSALEERQRHVTARDGAVTVEITSSGMISCSKMAAEYRRE
ncbi:MAG: DNA internalization-related competence protein ComEC/Rec2 [Planctomycetota bacterium]